MTAKKSVIPESEQTPEVDMDRIKAMMGPLPFESKADLFNNKKTVKKVEAPQPSEPATAPVVAAPSKEINDAAEEANATLKAMASNMGEAKITKVEEPGLTEEENSAYISSLQVKPTDETSPIVGDGVVSDDPAIVKAVNDIVAHEGDALLEAEDEVRDKELAADVPKTSLGTKLKALWARPSTRWAIIILIILLIAVCSIVPTSRYFVLNNVGIRASMGVTVIDNSTLQPLKNVSVVVSGVSAVTDSKGVAKLSNLKLGSAKLTINKRAFAPITRDITIGWGSNPEGQFRLAASGAQYSFFVTDYLSGKPIEAAEASSGEGNAAADKTGKIVLTLDTSGKGDTEEMSITVTSVNYRNETLKITAGNKEVNSVKMVPTHKDVFISKRSGKYDIYTIDIDGKNEQKIVSGTGIERDDMVLVPQQSSDVAAYIATRENVRNSDGYLLSTLYLIDTKLGGLTKADQSEQIQVIGWSNDGHLIYVKISAGASAANPKRHRLMSLNAKNVTENKEIAAANSFNDVIMSGDKVLYAPSNALQENPKTGLFSVNADGTGASTITDKETFNIFRNDYELLTINAGGKSYQYKIGAIPSSLAATNAPSSVNRLYINNAKNNKSMWLDDRDGKGVLLVYDTSTKKDTALFSKGGLQLPMYWLNDSTVIFRVNDGRETANYAVSSNGGEAKKIVDVTSTTGIGRWYYY